jgi:hypothetical protein
VKTQTKTSADAVSFLHIIYLDEVASSLFSLHLPDRGIRKAADNISSLYLPPSGAADISKECRAGSRQCISTYNILDRGIDRQQPGIHCRGKGQTINLQRNIGYRGRYRQLHFPANRQTGIQTAIRPSIRYSKKY